MRELICKFIKHKLEEKEKISKYESKLFCLRCKRVWLKNTLTNYTVPWCEQHNCINKSRL